MTTNVNNNKDNPMKTFTSKEIGEAIAKVNAMYPGNPDMPVAYILGDLENVLDIL